MVCNVTFNNSSVISWRSVLLVEETDYPEKISDLPYVTDNCYHIVSNTTRLSGIRIHNVSGDRHRLHRKL